MRYQKGSWSQFALECQWKTNREPAQEGRMSITITQIHNYTNADLQKKCKHTKSNAKPFCIRASLKLFQQQYVFGQSL